MVGLGIYAPEKITGQALCRLLEMRRLNPQYFDSLEQVLQKICLGEMDILILDLSSFREINKGLDNFLMRAAEIPIIMVTPYGVNEEELSGFHHRGYHIVEKPLSVEELVKLIYSIEKRRDQANQE